MTLSTEALREICEHGAQDEGGEFHQMAEELLKRREDEAVAAGELLVPIPEPGTDIARLLVANRLLSQKFDNYNALYHAAWDLSTYAAIAVSFEPYEPPEDFAGCCPGPTVEYFEGLVERVETVQALCDGPGMKVHVPERYRNQKENSNAT